MAEYVYTLVSGLLFVFLTLLNTAIWARVILGCLTAGEDTVFSRILFFLTEPFVLPVRKLLGRAGRIGMTDLSAVVLSALICAALAFLRL